MPNGQRWQELSNLVPCSGRWVQSGDQEHLHTRGRTRTSAECPEARVVCPAQQSRKQPQQRLT
eukprot:3303291-Alexandrium_andersonii.AAC.1